MAILIHGVVTSSVARSGTKINRETGEATDWAFHSVVIFDGTGPRDCSLGRDFGDQVPAVGEVITAQVRPGVGGSRLRLELERRVEGNLAVHVFDRPEVVAMVLAMNGLDAVDAKPAPSRAAN